jgi:NADH-quinone oxidoreductase subunit L
VTPLPTLWLIPALPLASFLVLFASAGRLPRRPTAILATGSVGAAALLTVAASLALLGRAEEAPVLGQALWTWLDVGGFAATVGLRFDGLALVMTSVVTGVGFLIHLYATGYQWDDDGYARFFAYMNLFVFSMLVLVLADNLPLLYLGWEGVGLCSYLLIGFHHRDPANGYAARKAFVVTRVGDAALAVALFLLFRELGTLHIDTLLQRAPERFAIGDGTLTVATVLLLVGAAGKSAQLPLHTWLPDAMAGPTPVSALIHAATMVTAGVYLIARLGELFLLTPAVLDAVALVGLGSVLVAACSALVQTDLKRILAYSTMSQIGFMFLALGVGAWSAAIFHLVTHAFFKALLFLCAGSVILSLHHEQDVRRMGGLRRHLPLPFAGTLAGAAALAALPLTSGWFSKESILLAAADHPRGLLLGSGALLASGLTAVYVTRMVCLVFLGPGGPTPHERDGWNMKLPLAVLTGLALAGGLLPMTVLEPVLPHGGSDGAHHGGPLAWLGTAVPVAGVLLGWLVWGPRGGARRADPCASTAVLPAFWRAGWGFDAAYRVLFERPFGAVARLLRPEPVDAPFALLASAVRRAHLGLARTQSGHLRTYALVTGAGLVLVLATALVLP